MNKLEISLEILKIIVSGESLAGLDINCKADVVLGIFQKVQANLAEQDEIYSAFSSLDNKTIELVKHYAFCSEQEQLNAKNQAFVSVIDNLATLLESGKTNGGGKTDSPKA